MRIAAAYIRVSTDDQIEFSPDSQLKALKRYADSNQILLPSNLIFIDEGISGRNTKKRPAFNAMIAMAKTKPKPFDVILVWKYSRFARSREDSVVYKSMLRKDLNIDVISVSEPVGDDKMSVLFEAIIEAMDEYYSVNLAEEVKRGMCEKAKRGGVLSIAPFGYKVKDGRYIVVPDEAAIIQKTFQDYISGKGFLTIANELNDIGMKTHRGNPIETRTIEYWLNNPVYTGKMRWNPTGALSRNYEADSAIIAEGMHEAIIDSYTWIDAQERLKKQKERYRKYAGCEKKKVSHWLVGLVRCGRCGAVLSNQGGYYGCSKKGRGLCPGVGYISAKRLEQIVISILYDIMPDKADVRFSPFNQVQNVEMSDIFAVQIKKLQSRLKRIQIAYEEGVYALGEYQEHKNEVTIEINKINREKEKYEKSSVATNSQQDKPSNPYRITQILKDPNVSNDKKNKAVKSIIKQIVKDGSEGTVLKFFFWE